VFFGKKNTDWAMNDLSLREKTVSVSLVIIIVGLGLFPQPVIDIAKPALLKTLDIHNEKMVVKSEGDKNENHLKSNLFLYK